MGGHPPRRKPFLHARMPPEVAKDSQPCSSTVDLQITASLVGFS
jgi:hypothetical protein